MNITTRVFIRKLKVLFVLALISSLSGCSLPCPPEPEKQVQTESVVTKAGIPGSTEVRIRYVIYRTDQGSLFICFPDAQGRPQQLSGSRGNGKQLDDGSRDIVVTGGQEEGKDVIQVIQVTTETDSGGVFQDTFDKEGNLIRSEELG